MPSSLSAKASNTLASFKHLAAAFHALSIASLIRTATSTRQHLGKRPRRAFAPHSRRLTLIGLTNTAVGCIANVRNRATSAGDSQWHEQAALTSSFPFLWTAT